MWKNITRITTAKRLASMGLGSVLVAMSLLVGALTSPAAADDHRWIPILRSEVASGYQLIEADPATPFRIDESRATPFAPGRSIAAKTPTLRSANCDIIFEGDPLLLQPDFGRNTFINEPWREQCSSTWTEVTASIYQHLHLGFENTDIGPCGSGPLAGQFAIIDDDFSCTDFDPLTEPRISPYSHSDTEIIEFRMYDADGYQDFRFDRIRVVEGPIRVCIHDIAGFTDTVVMNGGAGSPNATCWNLDEGYWDLSGHDADTRLVTLTGLGTDTPFAFDDIRIIER